MLYRAFFVLLCLSSFCRADDWPQWFGPQRDGVWRETGIIDQFPAAGPKIKWRTPIAAGYSSPAVANGKVFIIDREIHKGQAPAANSFERTKITGTERVLCLNAADGKVLWKDEYPCDYTISYNSGPRATPTIADGKVYTLGAEGHLRCYNIDDGKLLWQTRLQPDGKDTPMWGYSASPLIDGEQLICIGHKDAVVMSFDRNTGKPLWTALSADEPGYCPPVIFNIGGVRQLIIWHGEAICSLDPKTGKQYWSEKFNLNYGLSIITPRLVDDKLFFASPYQGSLMLQLDRDKPAAKRLWKRAGPSDRKADALHSLMSTPWIEGDHIYGVCLYGQLRCLDARNGDQLWNTLAPTTSGGEPLRWANGFLTPNAGRFFIANETGELIIAELSPKGYEEISRAKILEPTTLDAGRLVVWSHPAYANRCAYMRNDKEIVCVDLAK